VKLIDSRHDTPVSIDVLLRRIGPTNIHLHWVKKEERVTTRIELPRIQLHAVSPFSQQDGLPAIFMVKQKASLLRTRGFVFSGVDASHGKRRSISGSRNVLMLHVRAVGSGGMMAACSWDLLLLFLRSSPWWNEFGERIVEHWWKCQEYMMRKSRSER